MDIFCDYRSGESRTPCWRVQVIAGLCSISFLNWDLEYRFHGWARTVRLTASFEGFILTRVLVLVRHIIWVMKKLVSELGSRFMENITLGLSHMENRILFCLFCNFLLLILAFLSVVFLRVCPIYRFSWD